MRVLIVRNSYSFNFGGAERLAVSIASELQRHSVEPIVVSRQERLLGFATKRIVRAHKGFWWSHQDWSGFWLLLLPVYVLWQVVLVFWYLHLVLRYRLDVLHLMSRDDFIAGTIAGRLCRRPVVWTDCADLKHIYRNNGVWYKNPVGKMVYACSRLATAVTLVSKSEKTLVEASLGHESPANYRVMYLVCPDQKVSPASDADKQEDIVICSTSRLVVDKGIGDLIQAFDVVTGTNQAVGLWIIGDGPDETQFKSEADANSHIHFLGYKENPLQYLIAADIYVHPTYHEGFSLSLAEAAMLGKPIVATDVGGNPELLAEGGGLLVKPRNASELSDALTQLVQNPSQRKQFGEESRAAFLKNFNLETVVGNDLLSVYRGALDAHTD